MGNKLSILNDSLPEQCLSTNEQDVNNGAVVFVDKCSGKKNQEWVYNEITGQITNSIVNRSLSRLNPSDKKVALYAPGVGQNDSWDYDDVNKNFNLRTNTSMCLELEINDDKTSSLIVASCDGNKKTQKWSSPASNIPPFEKINKTYTYKFKGLFQHDFDNPSFPTVLLKGTTSNIQNVWLEARKKGFNTFGITMLDNTNFIAWGGNDIQYDKLGAPLGNNKNTIQVYVDELKSKYKRIDYVQVGCFKDDTEKAIPNFLGRVSTVEDGLELGRAKGYNVIGFQSNGEVWAGKNSIWDKYGPVDPSNPNPSSCPPLGGPGILRVFADRQLLVTKTGFGNENDKINMACPVDMVIKNGSLAYGKWYGLKEKHIGEKKMFTRSFENTNLKSCVGTNKCSATISTDTFGIDPAQGLKKEFISTIVCGPELKVAVKQTAQEIPQGKLAHCKEPPSTDLVLNTAINAPEWCQYTFKDLKQKDIPLDKLRDAGPYDDANTYHLGDVVTLGGDKYLNVVYKDPRGGAFAGSFKQSPNVDNKFAWRKIDPSLIIQPKDDKHPTSGNKIMPVINISHDCGSYGRPGVDKNGNLIRSYTAEECYNLGGDYYPKTGECKRLNNGGNFSNDCVGLNPQAPFSKIGFTKVHDDNKHAISESRPAPVNQENSTASIPKVLMPENTMMPKLIMPANNMMPKVSMPENVMMPKVSIPENTSSKKEVEIFAQCDYKGQSFLLEEGKYDIKDIGLPNDTISSIKIPNGYSITLFEKPGFSGRKLVLTKDDSCLVDNIVDEFQFTDSTSSLIVAKISTFENVSYNSSNLYIFDSGDFKNKVTKVNNITENFENMSMISNNKPNNKQRKMPLFYTCDGNIIN
jgi:hypothetical protein